MKEFKENFYIRTVEGDQRYFQLDFLDFELIENTENLNEADAKHNADPYVDLNSDRDFSTTSKYTNFGLKLNKEHIELERFSVSGSLLDSQVIDLKERFGIQIEDKMAYTLHDEMDRMEDKQLVNILIESADEIDFYEASNKNKLIAIINKIFGYKPRICFEQNQLGKRKMISKILMLSHKIAVESRRGAGNFICVSQETASMLLDFQIVELTSLSGTISPFKLIENIGSFSGISIYSSYLFPKNTIIVGRGSQNDNEPIIYQISNKAEISEFVVDGIGDTKNIVLTKNIKTGIPNAGKVNYNKFQFNSTKITFWKDLFCRIGLSKYPPGIIK